MYIYIYIHILIISFFLLLFVLLEPFFTLMMILGTIEIPQSVLVKHLSSLLMLSFVLFRFMYNIYRYIISDHVTDSFVHFLCSWCPT